MKLFTQVFPNNFDVDSDYPIGKAKNEVVQGDGLGTPWHEIVINDMLTGAIGALFDHSDVVADNSDEKAGNSQWLSAVKTLAQDMNYGENFKGSFAKGFTYTSADDIGRGQDGGYYEYIGSDPFPKSIPAGLDPSTVPADYVVTSNLETEFTTVDDAVNYKKISKLLGKRVYIKERGAYFDVVLTSTVTPNGARYIQSVSNVTYSLSLVVNNQMSLVNFGCVSDFNRVTLTGTDNYIALRDAFDSDCEIIETGTKNYGTSLPVFLPENKKVSAHGTTIINFNNGTVNLEKLCLVTGNWQPSYFNQITTYQGDSISVAENTVSLTTPSDASNFSIGDVVIVYSDEHYDGLTGPIPNFVTFATITDITSGVITLDRVISGDFSGVQIGHGNNSVIGALGRELYVCKNSKVEGLNLWSVYGNCFERGGALDCIFEFGDIRSLTGLFINCMYNCEINIRNIYADRKPIDFAGASNNNKITIGNINYFDSANSDNSSLVVINENSSANTIDINGYYIKSYSGTGAIVEFGSCYDNEIKIQKLTANIEGSPQSRIKFISRLKNDVGETQPICARNSLSVNSGSISGSGFARFFEFINDGNESNSNRLSLNLKGTPTVSAGIVRGDQNSIKGYYEGVISLISETNSVIDVNCDNINGYDRDSGSTVINNGNRFDELSKIQSTTVYSNSSNGGGGALSIAVDMTDGSTQNHAFTSATGVTIENPTNVKSGDVLKINLTNNNGSTGITPSFSSNYELDGVSTQVDAGNLSVYWFEAISSTRLIEVKRVENI